MSFLASHEVRVLRVSVISFIPFVFSNFNHNAKTFEIMDVTNDFRAC
jgi:hypothetical protein